MRDNTPVSRARQLTSNTWSGAASGTEYRWITWRGIVGHNTTSHLIVPGATKILTQVRGDLQFADSALTQISIFKNQSDVITYMDFNPGVNTVIANVNEVIVGDTDSLSVYIEYAGGRSSGLAVRLTLS